MGTVALIDYGSGNVHSAARALTRAAEGAKHGLRVTLTADPDVVTRADRVVLPGVGHFADCKREIDRRDGLTEALESAVIARGAPFLGICVGMQLMADFGAEDGDHRGFGWIHGRVDALRGCPSLRIPHMGWNEVMPRGAHPVLAELGQDAHAYFVHSYAFSPENEHEIAAVTDHGQPFVSAVGRDNLFGTQFHPEKSQAVGLKILTNFLNWRP